MKNLIVCAWIFALTAAFLPSAEVSAQTAGAEREEAPVEIRPEAEPPETEVREKITPPEGVPEVPKPVTRENVGPAEKVQLDEIEREYATGELTKPEYDVEKDALAREANVTF